MSRLAEATAPRYRAIVAKYRPAGYIVKKARLRGGNAAYAEFTREIKVEGIYDRSQLFYYFHEVGHITHGHLRDHEGAEDIPAWRAEYEADMFAIRTMREEGIPVPRDMLEHSKSWLRELIFKWNKSHRDEDVDEEVLRYAYGREWHKHA